jgi:hypothetical protein
MAKIFSETNVIPKEYWKLCMAWNTWGLIAILLPLANIYWMTFKPT